MSVSERKFGILQTGETVKIFHLENKSGAYAEVTDFGAILVKVCVPDKDGTLTDVVLGYDDLASYEVNGCFFGSTIGRNGNRIGGAKFSVNGKEVVLAQNENDNNLHSGPDGFEKKLWKVAEISDDKNSGIDHFRIDRHLDRFGHVTAGQIDRGRHAEIERNVRFLGRNKCRYHIGDVAARQIVRFQIVRGQVQPRFRSRDQLVDDHRGGDLAETHQHQLNQAHPHARYQRGKPQADRDKVKNEPQQHERHEGHDNPNSQFHTIYLLKVQYNSHNRTRLP